MACPFIYCLEDSVISPPAGVTLKGRLGLAAPVPLSYVPSAADTLVLYCVRLSKLRLIPRMDRD